jgi:hypothetical protein
MHQLFLHLLCRLGLHLPRLTAAYGCHNQYVCEACGRRWTQINLPRH